MLNLVMLNIPELVHKLLANCMPMQIVLPRILDKVLPFAFW